MNRTNNPLERYNKTLNSLFIGNNPNFFVFVEGLETESRWIYVNQQHFCEGKVIIPEHDTARINDVPSMYKAYIYERKKFLFVSMKKNCRGKTKKKRKNVVVV